MVIDRQQLKVQWIPLAVKIAKSFWYTRPTEEFEDLRSIAMIGLCYAANNYKPERAVPFRCYAAMAIRDTLISATRPRQKDVKATRVWLDMRDLESCIDDISENLQTQDVFERIRQMLLPRQYDLLVDLYLKRKSVSQVARERGVSTAAIREQLSWIYIRIRRNKEWLCSNASP